jgi:hypothetical protein
MLHLAFDLLNDSTIASRRALDSLEYTSVLMVGAVVTIFGFVPGDSPSLPSSIPPFLPRSLAQCHPSRDHRWWCVSLCDLCGAEQ